MLLHHWWNGSWGSMTRRDVWLEELPDGRFLIRWHGGDWRDRDGRYVTARPKTAIAVLRALLVPDESWREMPVGRRPGGGQPG